MRILQHVFLRQRRIAMQIRATQVLSVSIRPYPHALAII
jgi:hypothetical protein